MKKEEQAQQMLVGLGCSDGTAPGESCPFERTCACSLINVGDVNTLDAIYVLCLKYEKAIQGHSFWKIQEEICKYVFGVRRLFLLGG